MRIHQACQASGLTRKAILYYERQGLIQPSLRETGYRDFSRDDVESLKRIALLRRLGLSLEQVRTALDSPDGIKDAARRLRLQWAEYQERMELLDTLAEDGDFDRATRQMDALESKRSILSRLLTCFPGYYGQYLSLHFGAFLGEPITTQAQQDAFSTVIAFLDSVELKLPQDLREMLEEASQGMDDAFLSIQAAHMRQLAKNPAQYLDDHRPSLEAYMEYLRAADYHASPVYQLRQALIDFSRQSGYESVFLPAMRRLSPRYDAYCRSLDTANALFLAQYPDVANLLTP